MSHSKPIKQCPEFPYFGATYPDARCIDGKLYDLDNCDNEGNLYERGDGVPCPFCREKEYIKYHFDPLNGITKDKLRKQIEFLKQKYSARIPNQALDKATLK